MSTEVMLLEENRRLREELAALKKQQAAFVPSPPAQAPPPGGHPHAAPSKGGRGHPQPPRKADPVATLDSLLPPLPSAGTPNTAALNQNGPCEAPKADAGNLPAGPRGKGPCKETPHNSEVTSEFFSAHERNAALNVQRDIRQGIKIAEDRRSKLEDAFDVLSEAEEKVVESSVQSSGAIAEHFTRYRTQLRDREQELIADLDRHGAGEIFKIQREQVIVRHLLSTLDQLIVEAKHVMKSPGARSRNGGIQPAPASGGKETARDPAAGGDKTEDEERELLGCKTLAEIKDEFVQLRQQLLPWDLGYIFDMITAKASEQIIDIRTHAVHDIITKLVDTLSAARDKAATTVHTLDSFVQEVQRVVPETAGRISDEFLGFQRVATQEEDLYMGKVQNFRRTYTDRIRAEKEHVEEWISRLSAHQRTAGEAVDSGNDYHLLKELEALNQALVQVDASTLTLGYDTIAFKPTESILDSPLDRLGSLERHEIPCTPRFSHCHHFYHFLEHKDAIYGGSDLRKSSMGNVADITSREKDLFRAAFGRIKHNDDTLDAVELEVLWMEVFPEVPRKALTSITQRIFKELDSECIGRIYFDSFLGYISEGMRTNLAAQRDNFYLHSEM